MSRAIQFALLAALLGWLPGCGKAPTSLDTIIAARDALDYSIWEREHLPDLDQPWKADFPVAIFRLRVAEAYRTGASKPEEVEKVLLKKLHGSTIRDVLLESYQMKLYQLVTLQKLTEGWRAQGDSAMEVRSDELVETALLVERIRLLDPRFDFAAFKAAIHVVVPPHSGSGTSTGTRP